MTFNTRCAKAESEFLCDSTVLFLFGYGGYEGTNVGNVERVKRAVNVAEPSRGQNYVRGEKYRTQIHLVPAT